MVVLIERTARANIEKTDKGLDNFMPNKKDVRNPNAEYMLAEFQYVVRGEVPMPSGEVSGFVSELNPLQKNILQILEIPLGFYRYEYLFNTS